MPLLSANPASYYKMEEASGARLDSVGAQSANVFGADPSRVAGKHNFGAGFNGTTQALKIPYAAEFALGVNVVWTVTGWFYLDSLAPTADRMIVAKGKQGGANPNWYVFVRGSGASTGLSMVRQSVSGDVHVIDAVDSGGTLPFHMAAATWYFFAAGSDADGRTWLTVECNSRAYFAGGVIGVAPWVKQYAQDLTIGCGIDEGDGLPNAFFGGRIDELAYYEAALSDDDLGLLCVGAFYPFQCPARFNLKLSGRMNGDMYSAGAYGAPTALVLPDPVVGQVVILDVPVADVAGYVNGATGQTLIERVGDENCYAGDIAVSAIELYGDRVT